MPLVKHINSVGSFFNAMGERGNRYTYDGAQFIIDYYCDTPEYVQLDPINIVSIFKEYYSLREYCQEVLNGDDSILAAAEYVDLHDEIYKALTDIENGTKLDAGQSVELQSTILQSSVHCKELFDILETKPEFTCSKHYRGNAYMLENGSIMFVEA